MQKITGEHNKPSPCVEPLTQPLLCKYCRRERTPGKAKSMNKHPHLKCSYFTVIILFLEKKREEKKNHTMQVQMPHTEKILKR